MSELDPRWEWIELRALCEESPRYVKGRCNHLETTPVYAQDRLDRGLDWDAGQPVAHLCLTCDAQLPV